MKQLSLFSSIVLSLLLFSFEGFTQISNYSFSKSAGNNYTSISSTGTSVSLGDDANVQVSIGFYFFYNNHNYDLLNIGSNGYLAFGNYSATNYNNDLSSTSSGNVEVVAPFWDDLNPTSGGHIYYQTTGSSPNRKFIVEYNNIPTYSGSANVYVQVVLYEHSNNIEFCYGSSTGSSTSASIGINESPGGSSHFISITPGNPPTTSTTTSNNGITSAPASGINYLFTYAAPSCQITTNQSVSNIKVNSADLNWVDPQGSHWDVYVTSHGGSAPVQSTTPTANDVTSTTYNWSGGNASTSYDWYVRSDCGQNNTSTSSWTGPSTFTTTSGKATNPTPANGAIGIAISSKTLDWDDIATATGYHISVGTTSGGTQIVNNASASSSTYTLSSNWSYNTTYYWTVTTNFSGSNVTGDEWHFITTCGTASAPYTQNFTSWPPTCWITDHNNTGSTYDWSQYSSGSVKCAQASSSSTMISPTIDVSSLSVASVNFNWSHLYNSSLPYFSLAVEISDDGGSNWHQIWYKSGSNLNSDDGVSTSAPGSFINSGDINISSYGNNVLFRFKTGSSSGYNVFVDDFNVREMPACPAPTDLSSSNIAQTTAELDWTELGSATTWKIEYGPVGFTPGQGTVISNITSKPYTLTGLSAMTAYDWYVRADCGGGSTSVLSSKASFQTEHYTVSTTGKTCRCSPNFTRPGGSGSTYFYDKYSFTVPATDVYNMKATFQLAPPAHGVFAGYLYLYQNSFDPKNPSTNLIASNGSANVNTAQISQTLSASTTYILVGTTYHHDSWGGIISFTIEGSHEATANSTADYNGVPTGITHEPNYTDGDTYTAAYQCLDQNGWTHYYDDGGTASEFWDDAAILSVKKNGNNIGDIGDQGFSVTVAGSQGASHIIHTSAPYVSSWGGWWVFNRYWVLTPTSQPSSDVNVKFYYEDGDFNNLVSSINQSGGTPPSGHTNMSCFKINNISGNYDPNPANGHSGIPLAQSYDGDGCWVYTNGNTASSSHWKYTDMDDDFNSMEYVVKHFSGGGGGAAQHTGSGNGSPLPIELLDFNVVSLKSGNMILWKTATEEDVNYFEIERLNPIDSSISIIGRTQAAGNSNTIQSYSMADQKSLSKAYYRLVEMDFDGKKTTFEWHYAERQITDFKLIGLYPNPAQSVLNIDLYSAAPANGIIQIRDISGRMIMEQKIELLQNNQSFKISVNDLAEGSYHIIIQTNFSKINKLFIKE